MLTRKPTKDGWYLVNYGDVVTEANSQPARVVNDKIHFFDGDIVNLKDLNNSFKFLNISKLGKELDP